MSNQSSMRLSEEAGGYTVARVGLSLPCSLPVLPGTPNADAPLNERTEKCSVDAWWFVGALPICDLHFRQFCEMVGDDYADVVAKFRALGWGEIPNETERKPWAEMHRYEQPSEPSINRIDMGVGV